ncbi:jacalin-related lectin 40-like, partial [Cornus florida]|uniref:jacalin-related lectin 40-like n=1 Tax=Cornus florida TaxID=4283 RepID=UPI00289F7BE7
MGDGQIVYFGAFGVAPPASFHRKWDDGTYKTVRELFIEAKSEINSIQFVYDTEGDAVVGKKYGDGGGKPYQVKLDYPTEYLVSISGTMGATPYLNKLLLLLDFGGHVGCVDAIGVYVKPLKVVVTVGPFGTTGGQQWDDGTYST